MWVHSVMIVIYAVIPVLLLSSGPNLELRVVYRPNLLKERSFYQKLNLHSHAIGRV